MCSNFPAINFRGETRGRGLDRKVSSDASTGRVAIKTEGVRNFTPATHGTRQEDSRDNSPV